MADRISQCENCEGSHDGSYGSGRFCNAQCARAFATKRNREDINHRVSCSLKGRKVGGTFRAGYDANRYKYQCPKCKGWFRGKEKQGYCAHVLHCVGIVPKETRIPFTLESRRRGHATVRNRIASLPFDEAPRAEKYRRVFHEQGNSCLHCGVGRVWNGAPLVLEIDHVDGNHSNDKRENLRGLCPNCHSQTPTYRNKCRDGEIGETHQT